LIENFDIFEDLEDGIDEYFSKNDTGEHNLGLVGGVLDWQFYRKNFFPNL
jgi:hypothetical protein